MCMNQIFSSCNGFHFRHTKHSPIGSCLIGSLFKHIGDKNFLESAPALVVDDDLTSGSGFTSGTGSDGNGSIGASGFG